MNYKLRILSTVSLFHGVNDGAIAVIPLMFPILKEMFNLSYTQIGLITGGGLAVLLLTEISVGRAFDITNSRILLASGIFILSCSMFILSFSYNFITLLLFVFLLRFSSGFFHPAGIGLISKIFKKDRLDWAMGIQSAFGDLGAFIAILTTLYIAVRFGWMTPLYFWAILSLICLFIGLSLTKHIPSNILSNRNLKNKKQTPSEAILEWYVIIKRFRLLIPLFVVSSISYGLTISYLPLFLDEKTTLSLSSIGYIISLWVGVGVIICLFYGKIQSYLKRKNIILFSYFIIGLMGFLITIFTSIHLLVVIVILLGISTFMSFPALFSFVSEATHESAEGKTFGYIFTIQLGIGTLFLFMSGVLADFLGIWVPFVILGITGLFASMMIILNRKNLFVFD